jgi:hypothetical protein
MVARQELLLLEPLHQPFFDMDFSQIRSPELFAPGWHGTTCPRLAWNHDPAALPLE